MFYLNFFIFSKYFNILFLKLKKTLYTRCDTFVFLAGQVALLRFVHLFPPLQFTELLDIQTIMATQDSFIYSLCAVCFQMLVKFFRRVEMSCALDFWCGEITLVIFFAVPQTKYGRQIILKTWLTFRNTLHFYPQKYEAFYTGVFRGNCIGHFRSLFKLKFEF